MGELRIVKLRFMSTLHLGADVLGIGIEDSLSIAHSDTVFSCLINAYAELHSGDVNAVDELLAPFHDGNPPFRISSAFPFRKRESEVRYYLPRPLMDPLEFYDPRNGQDARKNYGKLIRNLPIISVERFKDYWLQPNNSMAKRDLEAAKKEIRSLCVPTIRPQHTRDRLTDATSIYHTGLVHFAPNSGLYFLIEINDTSILSWDKFQAVLELAGANGLGGRRNHGNGAFDVEEDTIEPLDQAWEDLFKQKQSGFLNLSLYRPESQTLKSLNPVAYQLVPRRGWCYSSVTSTQMKRKAVIMFGEGSVFHKDVPKGTLADVTPDTEDSKFTAHKLYRYGIPISLPIKIWQPEDMEE
jgi:CRISPR-associated protein Csm4